MIDWITSNWIEIFGALAGLVYIVLEIKEKTWVWPVGILTSAFYIVVFFNSKFYADMGLSVYFVLISIYGWYNWKRGGQDSELGKLGIHNLKLRTALFLILLTLIIFVILGFGLSAFTDSPMPWWDACTTSLGITGTWMLARKILEQWWVWILANAICVWLYWYRGLHPTSILYFVYLIMSIVGYITWSKNLKTQETRFYV